MQNDVLRFTHGVLLTTLLLTTALGVVGCRSDGIRVRSWDEAIRFAQRELETAGDLSGRLEGYARTAVLLGAKIEAVDQARPALELIDKLRDIQVPMVGNGWRILLTLLSLATVDGARILARLDETLRALHGLKDSLDGLEGLPAVAAAVSAFRNDPSRDTLSRLADESADPTAALSRLHADLGEVLMPLREASDNLSTLVDGLQEVARADVPAVSNAARQAAQRIGAIEEPLLALRDGLDQMHQDIQADVRVLENIQEAVRQARERK